MRLCQAIIVDDLNPQTRLTVTTPLSIKEQCKKRGKVSYLLLMNYKKVTKILEDIDDKNFIFYFIG